jgi:hypothetical protein
MLQVVVERHDLDMCPGLTRCVAEGPDFDGVPELQAEVPKTAAPTTAATEPARADLLEIAPSVA